MTRDWSTVSKFSSFDLLSQLYEYQSPYVSRALFKTSFAVTWCFRVKHWLRLFFSLTCECKFCASSKYSSKFIDRTHCTQTRHCPGNATSGEISVFLIAREKTFQKLYWKLRTHPAANIPLPMRSSSRGSMLEISNPFGTKFPPKLLLRSLDGKSTRFTTYIFFPVGKIGKIII